MKILARELRKSRTCRTMVSGDLDFSVFRMSAIRRVVTVTVENIL